MAEGPKEVAETTAPAGRKRVGGLPIGAALSLAIGGLVAVTAAAVLYLGLIGGREATSALMRDKAQLIVGAVVDRVRAHLEPAYDQSVQLARAISKGEIAPDDVVRLSDFMIASLGATPQVAGLLFVDKELQALRVLRQGEGFAVELVSLEGRHAAGEIMRVLESRESPYWGEIVWAPLRQQSVVNLRTPVRVDGALVGAVFSAITVAQLSTYLSEFENQTGEQAFILYGDDKVLAHPALIHGGIELSAEKPLPGIPEVGDPVLNAAFLARDTNGNGDEGEMVAARAGLDVVTVGGADYALLMKEETAFGPIPWRVGAYVRLQDLAAGLERLREAMVAGGIVLLIAVFAGLLLGRRLTGPIRTLAAAARHARDLSFENSPALSDSAFRETREAGAAFNAMLAGLRAFSIYVPRSLVRRLLRHGDVAALVSEEREVTVLFTDIVGFTGIAEGLDAQQLADMLNRHFTLVTDVVERWQGTVDKYIGDSVMAFWGAPEHQPDHPALAVACALDMLAAVGADNARRVADGEPPLRVRIGVHTGPAIVGNVGGPTRVDYTLIGDTVNTASRVVDLARDHLANSGPGVVLISETTAAALPEGFSIRSLGETDIRGRQERLGLALATDIDREAIQPPADDPGRG